MFSSRLQRAGTGTESQDESGIKSLGDNLYAEGKTAFCLPEKIMRCQEENLLIRVSVAHLHNPNDIFLRLAWGQLSSPSCIYTVTYRSKSCIAFHCKSLVDPSITIHTDAQFTMYNFSDPKSIRACTFAFTPSRPDKNLHNWVSAPLQRIVQFVRLWRVTLERET